MSKIGKGYGSEWHLLRYLGYHRNKLNDYVLDQTGGSAINWLDFPFGSASGPFEDDAEWTGVKAIPEATVKSSSGKSLWQIFIYFCCERNSPIRKWDCPKNQGGWHSHIDKMHTHLDIDLSKPLMQRVHHVFIPINSKC